MKDLTCKNKRSYNDTKCPALKTTYASAVTLYRVDILPKEKKKKERKLGKMSQCKYNRNNGPNYGNGPIVFFFIFFSFSLI